MVSPTAVFRIMKRRHLPSAMQCAPVSTVRMYRGTPPQLPLARIYGITSFEVG